MEMAQEITMPYEGLAFKIARKYFPYCGPAVDFEDLLQAGAIGALRAQKTFDPEKGSWSSWVALLMGQEMQAYCMLCGNKPDPCLHALSLDAPLMEDEDGLTLGETIPADNPDPLDDIDREQVGAIVRHAVSKLRADRRQAVELVDLDGMTIPEAAALLGEESHKIKTARQVAFEYLKRDAGILRLKESCCIREKTYRHVSLKRYRVTHMSTVEKDAFCV